MADWQDEVANEIVAASVRMPAYGSPNEQKLLRTYVENPAKADEIYQQTLRVYEFRTKRTVALFLGGTALVFAGLLLHGLWQWAPIFLSIPGGIAMISAFMDWVFTEELEERHDIDKILQRDSHFYLPAVNYETDGDTLKVSLSDKHTTYAVRTFGVGEETAALEYQVELEAILASVSGYRALQYAKARTATLQPDTRPTATLSAATPEIQEMKTLLKSQRQSTVITRGDSDLIVADEQQLIQ